MIFDPDHLACQVHEPHRRPRDRARIGRSTMKFEPRSRNPDNYVPIPICPIEGGVGLESLRSRAAERTLGKYRLG
jgi:hypothetical protein